MGRGEPTLVPEWYRVANGGGTPNANSNHHFGSSSHSDEHGTGLSSRNRLSLSTCGRESPRSLYFTKSRSSSFRKCLSDDGFISHDRDSLTHPHPYSSFARRNLIEYQDKDPDLHDRERLPLKDSTSHLASRNRSEKDSLRHSHSASFSGRRLESFSKWPVNDSSGVAFSGGTVISGIGKAIFDRDFPSLGAEESQGHSETGKCCSPGLNTAVQSLPIGASTISGGDGWTSALAEVPVGVESNGSVISSALKIGPVSSGAAVTSTSAGLNMAEALAQAPSRVHAAPQFSADTSTIDQLTLRKFKQLIPVTPSSPKPSGLNFIEKTKTKVARVVDIVGPSKGGHQLSSRLVVSNNALHAPAPKSDAPKSSHTGNFLILNRERNGIISRSVTAKDVGPGASSSVSPQLAVPPLKNSIINPKSKAECKGGTNFSSKQSSFGEKRSLSQVQNRNDFFNSLRKKTSINHLSTVVHEPNCCAVVPSEENGNSAVGSIRDFYDTASKEKSVSEQTSATSCASSADINQKRDSGGASMCVLENENTVGSRRECYSTASCEEVERFLLSPEKNNGDQVTCWEPQPVVDLDEKEAAFLRSLGWEEDAGEEALTAEEIAAFVKEYEKLRPSSRLSNHS